MLASGVGVVLALAVGLWFLSYQQRGLATPQFASDFYDEQVRSWLRGTWSIPSDVVLLEGIRTASGLQMYFGPFPALLRLPILMLTDSLDGQLAQPFMLVAYAVFLGSVTWLWWQVRAVVLGPGDIARLDGVLGAAAVLSAGVGSIFVTTLTSTTVYFEAIVWGVALAVLAYALLLSCLRTFRWSTAVGAIAAATAAMLSRVSVGGGALVAVWAVGIVWAAAWMARNRETRTGRAVGAVTSWSVPALRTATATTGQVALWLGGAVAGTAAYMGVNYARFGVLASIPWSGYVFNELSSQRAESLAANNDNLTGLRFVPTTLWNYLRPDGLDFDSRLPWITLPRHDVTRIGDVVLDQTAPSASLTAVMPLFLALAIVGLVAAVARRPPPGPSFGSIRLPLFGALAGVAPMLLSSFLAHRYLSDALPLLILGGFVGFWVIWRRLNATGTPRRRALVLGIVAALATWGIVANLAVSVEAQNLLWPRDEAVRYDFVRRQHAGSTGGLAEVTVVPAPGPRGELVSVGACEALLWSNGGEWVVLEGRVSPEAWTPDPTAKFFDHIVSDPSPGREPVLCRQMRNG